MSRILIVDDKPATRMLIRDTLSSLPDVEFSEAESVKSALAAASTLRPDVVLLALNLPDGSGLQALRGMLAAEPRSRVIVVTGETSSALIIQATMCGAYDCYCQPIDADILRDLVVSALNARADMDKPVGLPIGKNEANAAVLVGNSRAMRKIYQQIGRVARDEIAVLITGESGVGKELVARAIVSNSSRSQAPYEIINCAAIPDNLLESELFGHERGAFTGADTERIGKFEYCNGGTVFLDEVGDMPLLLQAKILRILQEKTFERLGSNRERKADVRILSATNQPLAQLVQEGRFREDLYFRLAQYAIQIPPLRQRPEDITVLLSHFLNKMAEESGRGYLEGISIEALKFLQDYHWPGNVRQLQSTIRQAVLNASGTIVQVKNLPPTVLYKDIDTVIGASTSLLFEQMRLLAGRIDYQLHSEGRNIHADMRREFEQILLSFCLQRHAFNVTHTADQLGISRATLRKKAHELGILNAAWPTTELDDDTILR